MDKNGHLIVFHKGKRVDKKVPRANLREAAKKVQALRAKGIKAHLAYRTDNSLYPPGHQIEAMRNDGLMWCPYCRAWRYFRLPKNRPHAEMNSREWFLNSFRAQNIKVCSWCEISEVEWYVKRANGTWGEAPKRKRRRNRRKLR